MIPAKITASMGFLSERDYRPIDGARCSLVWFAAFLLLHGRDQLLLDDD